MSEIAVLGAGIMGHGIALVFALGGHAVRLTDSRAETLAKAPALMASALETLREPARSMPRGPPKSSAGRCAACASLKETVQGAEVVIEAITELPEAKRALFQEIDPLAWRRHDPGLEHELSRRLPADPGAAGRGRR